MRTTPLNDMLLGALSLALGIWVTVVTADYPSAGGGFPHALAVYLILPLAVLLLLKGLGRLWTGEEAGDTTAGEDPAASQFVRFTPITLGVIGAVCMATLAIGYVGFVPAIALLAALMGPLFGARLWAIALYVVALWLVLWGFLRFFSIQMPEGVLPM